MVMSEQGEVSGPVLTAKEYAAAAMRPNTKKAYAASIAHFERWGGLLPARVDAVRDYLAAHAQSLSISALVVRLAALSHWHRQHGFPDPTKDQGVRDVLSGIRAKHAKPQRQAKALEIQTVKVVADHLSARIAAAQAVADRLTEMHCSRDRAILLLGFWRGLRMDEIAKIRIELVSFHQAGMTFQLTGTKTSANGEFIRHDCAPMDVLCPVEACRHWVALAGKDSGPLFSKINRWGVVCEEPLRPNSLSPLLRAMLHDAGVEGAEDYSGHSLRRGLATYATSCKMTLKEVMQLVGWKDPRSALRYQSTNSADVTRKLTSGLNGLQHDEQPHGKPVLVWQSA